VCRQLLVLQLLLLVHWRPVKGGEVALKKQFIWVIKSKHYLLKFLFQTLQNVKIFQDKLITVLCDFKLKFSLL